MTLDRPLCFLDLETEGPGDPDPAKDRIIQIGICWHPDSPGPAREQIDLIVNPGITVRRTEIHGITQEQASDAMSFSHTLASRILALFEGADIVTYNGQRYDIPLLWEECNRAGIQWDTSAHRLIDLYKVWETIEPRKLANAYLRFTGKQLVGGHDALGDAVACRDILYHMQVWDKHLGPFESVDAMAELTSEITMIQGQRFQRIDLAGVLVRHNDGSARFTHKRVRGKRVQDDPGYARWILGQDFSANTKMHLRRELTALTKPQPEDELTPQLRAALLKEK